MRITNTMITGNTKANINSNKLLVDKYNTQMTTQKKIAKASENPVIAIRSLRLSTTMSHINQYVNNNIPDASAWMDVTETALTNMESILSDIRNQCVYGSTDTLKSEDRQTILEALKSLSEQVYAEGNADYAGKTVFTGYRSTSNLTFDEQELDTVYEIDQTFDFSDLEEKRYYTGTVKVPEAVIITPTDTQEATKECDTQVLENTYERIRLAYNGDTEVNEFSYQGEYSYQEEENGVMVEKTGTVQIKATRNTDGTYEVAAYEVAEDGTLTKRDSIPADFTEPKVTSYATETEWEAEKGTKTIADNEIIYIEETGEFIFGKEIANNISDKKCTMDVNYTKTGFDKGELRPEYYYDCVDISDDDASKHVKYTKQDQPINYEIASNTTITINTQADQVFDTSIARDVDELINIVQKSITANNKVTQLQEMMEEAQYADDKSQEILQGYLDAAKKEADYADDNLQKTYEKYITRFDGYLEKVNIAITNVGSAKNSLELTKNRVENQQMTIEELQSDNEDRDISEIIIDYYAAYNAYTSSLTAASKLGERSLLDYI